VTVATLTSFGAAIKDRDLSAHPFIKALKARGGPR
jgi:hypothetical protein